MLSAGSPGLPRIVQIRELNDSARLTLIHYSKPVPEHKQVPAPGMDPQESRLQRLHHFTFLISSSARFGSATRPKIYAITEEEYGPLFRERFRMNVCAAVSDEGSAVWVYTLSNRLVVVLARWNDQSVLPTFAVRRGLMLTSHGGVPPICATSILGSPKTNDLRLRFSVGNSLTPGEYSQITYKLRSESDGQLAWERQAGTR